MLALVQYLATLIPGRKLMLGRKIITKWILQFKGHDVNFELYVLIQSFEINKNTL